MLQKIKERFELGRRYQFDPTDLVAIIYAVGVVLTLCGLGYAGTVLLAVGALISFVATCISGRRLNLFIIGALILALDIYFLLQ